MEFNLKFNFYFNLPKKLRKELKIMSKASNGRMSELLIISTNKLKTMTFIHDEFSQLIVAHNE